MFVVDVCVFVVCSVLFDCFCSLFVVHCVLCVHVACCLRLLCLLVVGCQLLFIGCGL